MSEKPQTFVKGGCGCLLAFLMIAALTLLLGGQVRIDLVGVVMLFVIGGVMALIALAIYKKGYAAGQNSGREQDESARLAALDVIDDEASELLNRASILDSQGEWDQAIEIFESVLNEPRYSAHHQYARNCIGLIKKKKSMGDRSD